jgi:hypothetical protein
MGKTRRNNMKHLYGGMKFSELAQALGAQTESLVEVKRVFSKMSVGSLVRIHLLEVTHDAPEGASLSVFKDYYKGVLDMFTPDMLKILVRAEEEVEPTLIRINIEEVIDAPEILKSFDIYTGGKPMDQPWTIGSIHGTSEGPKEDYLQDIIEYLDENSVVRYVIEVI